MFVATKNSHASPKVTNRSYLLSLLVAVVFALTINLNKIRAQIFNDVRINVLFQSYAGKVRHPLGEYRLGSDNTANQQWGRTDFHSIPSGGDKHTFNVREERTVFFLVGMVLLSGLASAQQGKQTTTVRQISRR
jgi:hypothetical protein